MKNSQPAQNQRITSRKGQTQIPRKGLVHSQWTDLYHWILTLSWPGFLGLIILLYLLSNTVFAGAYLLEPDAIANAKPGSFQDAFSFSVQTMATIGYGAMYPKTPYANIIVAIEALVGLLGVAIVTGLAFARFSIPTAKIIFTQVAVIAPYNGIPTLMFRAANQRSNQILEAQVTLSLVRNETTLEGEFIRRFYELPLVRSQTPIFALTWTIMHPITEQSPLWEMNPEQLLAEGVELVVTMTGLDETVSQIIHARHSYLSQEIFWNMRFIDILHRLPDGRRYVDYTYFHEIEPIHAQDA